MKNKLLALFLALCTVLLALPAALAEGVDALNEEYDALTSEAIEAEVAIADETGAEGLEMDDSGYDFTEEVASTITGTGEIVANAAADDVPKGWQNGPFGWQYMDEFGNYPVSTWKMIDGAWYYFDDNGVMHTGWLQQGGKWYYMNSSGVMLANTTITIGGKDYTFDSTGAWVQVSGGWKKDGYGWWYQNGDGTYPRNEWKLVDGKWYHFDALGYMQTGWLQIGTPWYYFDGSGAMRTGWVYSNGKWYYMNANGAMVTGRISVGDKGYYMDKNGAMVTDMWIKDDGDLFCYGSDGVYQSGVRYYGNIYFLVDCYGSRIRGKVNPTLSYNDGWYLNTRYGCKCNSSGLIRSVIITKESTRDANYHLFSVRPGDMFYSSVSTIQQYGFKQVSASGTTYMYRSSNYAYPLYISKDGIYVKSILYGSLN